MKLLLIFVFFFGMMSASVLGRPKASEMSEGTEAKFERPLFRRDAGSQDDLQPEASANHHGGHGFGGHGFGGHGFGGHHGGFGGYGGGYGGFGGHGFGGHGHHGGYYGRK